MLKRICHSSFVRGEGRGGYVRRAHSTALRFAWTKYGLYYVRQALLTGDIGSPSSENRCSYTHDCRPFGDRCFQVA